jgi:hypothetical protein
MKNVLDKTLISRARLIAFARTVIILMTEMTIIVGADALCDLNLNFFIMVGIAVVSTAVTGLLVGIRNYASGKETSFVLNVVGDLYALITVFGLITFIVGAYR